MEHTSILELAVRVLATAAGAVLICVRLRIPSVAGLLVAGAFVGPFGLGWVTEVEAVERVAEIGVVLLLFVIGLEFSRERLRELGRFALVGGRSRSPSRRRRRRWRRRLRRAARGPALVGCVVCGSSTALLLKVYGDRGELESLHGRAALGVSLFQDVLFVPMLVAVPAARHRLKADRARGGCAASGRLAARPRRDLLVGRGR
jgi:monovalent cation:H+ antiporter-2, CPA2 family